MTSGRRVGIAVTVVLAAVLVACGAPPMPAAEPIENTSLTFPTLPPLPPDSADDSLTDTGSAASATTGGPVATEPAFPDGEWVDITANLVGLESDCGNVSFVVGHPELDQVIVGIALFGLWALAPESNGWLPLGTGSGSDRIENRTGAVVFDPADPKRFWESGIYSSGAFETQDGGATFRQLGSVEHTDAVSVDFTDPERSTLLAGGHERTALYLSTDGGATWRDIGPNLPADAGFSSYPAVIGADSFLVGTSSSDNAGIFRSSDTGATWTKVFDAPVHGTPMIDGATISWLTTDGWLAVSRDGGDTFERAESPTTETGRGRPTLLRLPDGSLAAVGERSIVVSADLGATWREIGPPLPYEPVGLAYSAARATFYVWTSSCNVGGANPVAERGIMQYQISDVG